MNTGIKHQDGNTAWVLWTTSNQDWNSSDGPAVGCPGLPCLRPFPEQCVDSRQASLLAGLGLGGWGHTLGLLDWTAANYHSTPPAVVPPLRFTVEHTFMTGHSRDED